MRTYGPQLVVRGARLKIANVDVAAIGVRALRMARTSYGGTRNRTVGLTHVTQPDFAAVAEVPVGSQAICRRRSVLKNVDILLLKIAAPLALISFAVNGVIPVAGTSTWVKIREAAAACPSAAPIRQVRAGGDGSVRRLWRDNAFTVRQTHLPFAARVRRARLNAPSAIGVDNVPLIADASHAIPARVGRTLIAWVLRVSAHSRAANITGARLCWHTEALIVTAAAAAHVITPRNAERKVQPLDGPALRAIRTLGG